jgi:hypothetical protein
MYKCEKGREAVGTPGVHAIGVASVCRMSRVFGSLRTSFLHALVLVNDTRQP